MCFLRWCMCTGQRNFYSKTGLAAVCRKWRTMVRAAGSIMIYCQGEGILMEHFVLESCVDSVESAVIAAGAGANRLELCANLIIGGTTPTKALYEAVREQCGIPVHVLIRPRYGDFCYSEQEYRICRKEVEQFRRLGADGVVIGILRPDGSLNREQLAELTAAADGMSVTLHRAFDMCRDPLEALETARELGIRSILTSGQEADCLKGKECIRRLVECSRAEVDILVGGGVNGSVIRTLYEATGATSYHMSGKQVLDSRMEYRREGISMGAGGLDEYAVWQAKEQYIREAAEVLKNL